MGSLLEYLNFKGGRYNAVRNTVYNNRECM